MDLTCAFVLILFPMVTLLIFLEKNSGNKQLNLFYGAGIAAVPMVEAMVALVLVDQLMAQYAQNELFPINPALQEPLEIRDPNMVGTHI